MRVGGNDIEAQTRVAATISVGNFSRVAIKGVCDGDAPLVYCHAHVFASQFGISIIKPGEDIIPVEWAAVSVFIHIDKPCRGNDAVACYQAHCRFIPEV